MFQSGLQQHPKHLSATYPPYTSKLVCQWNRGENRFSISSFLLAPVYDGVSKTCTKFCDNRIAIILSILFDYKDLALSHFLLHKERILSSSLCLAMTNMILAYWDILCWSLTLNEKEGKNKAIIFPADVQVSLNMIQECLWSTIVCSVIYFQIHLLYSFR